eukprot:CAMPEP_0117664026 /NCGR_PEP_ID=MMETSP0804-20121206/8965_1 /TAXON_ID=1074897 /ORGANISM="Tetraselmis astigmatica, Strain CCMP880" /LENGTH=123 /DNA_ID=CAMNT_0005471161 /DNA_START=476 /DNA_END=847 /DNA_ORIENTATION=-
MGRGIKGVLVAAAATDHDTQLPGEDEGNQPPNIYDILGLERTATMGEMKKAYRHKARELHPDVNTSENAVEEFVQLQKAYEKWAISSRQFSSEITGSAAGREFMQTRSEEMDKLFNQSYYDIM